MSLFACPLKVARCVAGDSIGVVEGETCWTFTEWDRYVNQLSHSLENLGLQSGQRVAIVVPNSLLAVSIIVALWRFEVVVCPLSTRYTEEQLREARRVLQVEHCWREVDLQKLYSESKHQELEYVGKPLDDTTWATMMTTSGSSGQPKYVVHHHRNLYFSASGVNDHLDFDKNSGWAMTLPLYHMGGFSVLTRVLQAQGILVIPTQEQSLSEVCAMDEVSHISLVATQLKRLLDDEEAVDYAKNLYAIVVGGSAVSKSLLQEAADKKLRVHTSYGLTEMASQVCTSLDDTSEGFPLHSGELVPFRELKLAEDGEVWVKGDSLCRGYWTENGLEFPFDAEGWYHTGDIAEWLDADEEQLVIKGRKDAMFISGGENIYPEEIEQCLLGCEGFQQVVVVPREDEEFGQRPVAFIQSDRAWTTEECETYVAQHLETFKVPDAFYPWPENVQVTMKPQRKHFEVLL